MMFAKSSLHGNKQVVADNGDEDDQINPICKCINYGGWV